MSTNYYLPQKCAEACSHCSVEDLHVGKRSMGWTFGFQALPGIRARKDWEAQIAQVGKVVDEYGVEHSPEEFWAIVDETREASDGRAPLVRAKSKGRHGIPIDDDPRSYLDPEGWDFTEHTFF